MGEDYYKKIFSENLKYYMSINEKTQVDIINDLGVNKSSISTWCNGTRLPRMDKVDMLAKYFHINRSDLIEERPAADLSSPASPLTDLDMEVANKFHDADSISKAMVMKALDIELDDKKEKGIA
ncbi:MAG: hypothetical protein LUG61_08810 [Lachnospiraceae bacterium]|nr:hypothetical protein [Lachnospiraceae bacterium]